MDDYSYAAEQMKEAIVSEYLKEHPDVKRREVLTKLVNGRYVVGTIQDVFKEMQGRKKGQTAQLGRKELLNELAKGGDERYQACLDSIKSSEKYIDWLSVSKFTGFSEQDKIEHKEYLHRQSAVCSKCTLDLYDSKAKFVQKIKEDVKPSRSQINTLVLEYMQSVYGQLKAQRSIFKREVELGDWFTNATKGFFATQFSSVRSNPNPAAMRAIARAIAILKDNDISVPELHSPDDVKAFDLSLNELKDKLENRRIRYEELKEILQFLESVIEELKLDISSPKKDEPPKNNTNRMAFSSKRVR